MKRLCYALLFAAFAVSAAGCTATQGSGPQGNGNPAQRAAASQPAPAPESFTPGACRAMADDVIGVWNMATSLEGQPMTRADRNALKARQDALRAAMRDTPSPEVRQSLGKLVNVMGWNMLLWDTGNHDPNKHMAWVVQADSALQNACGH